MNKRIWIVTAAAVIALLVAALFAQKVQSLGDDPFTNLFEVLQDDGWKEQSLPGAVIAYQSLIKTDALSDYMPHFDGGDGSIGFTVALTLEGDLKGNWTDDHHYLTCFRLTFSAIDTLAPDIRDNIFPEEILTAARQQSANRNRYPDADKPVYLRRCNWVVQPRDPEAFNQEHYFQQHPVDSDLMQRCIDAIARRFVGIGADPVIQSDSQVGSMVLFRVFPGTSRNGELVGAYCRETLHPSGQMYFASWYMRYHEALE